MKQARFVALVMLVSACGGDSKAGSPSTPSEPATPPVRTNPAAGIVYLRADTVAYPPDYAPAAGLSGATVTLNETSVQSQTSGYTLRSPFTPGAQFVQLKASMPGHADSWYPWIPPDTIRPMPIGVYPAPPVTPRPNFIKGADFMDGGGYMSGWLRAGAIPSTAERLKSIGANTVSYPDLLRVIGFNATTNVINLQPEPLGPNTDFNAVFSAFVGAARARGLKIMLRLMLFSASAETNPSGVPATNTAFWDAWFAAVQPWIVDRAIRARQDNVDYLMLELPQYMLGQGSSRFRGVVDGVRATGYSGKIFVSFGVRPGRPPAGFYGYRFVDAALWNLVDGVELKFGDVIARTNATDTLDRAHSRAGMRAGIKAILDDVVNLPVPVYLEIGTGSVHGGVSTSEYIEACLQCPTIARQRTRDYQQQADVYQALAEVINATPTGKGRVNGVMSWGYVWTDDLFEFEAYGFRAFDKSSSIRGKPAEAVLKWWFERW